MVETNLYFVAESFAAGVSVIGVVELLRRYVIKKQIERETGKKMSILDIKAYEHLKDVWEGRKENKSGRYNILYKFLSNPQRVYVLSRKEIKKE